MEVCCCRVEQASGKRARSCGGAMPSLMFDDRFLTLGQRFFYYKNVFQANERGQHVKLFHVFGTACPRGRPVLGFLAAGAANF